MVDLFHNFQVYFSNLKIVNKIVITQNIKIGKLFKHSFQKIPFHFGPKNENRSVQPNKNLNKKNVSKDVNTKSAITLKLKIEHKTCRTQKFVSEYCASFVIFLKFFGCIKTLENCEQNRP